MLREHCANNRAWLQDACLHGCAACLMRQNIIFMPMQGVKCGNKVRVYCHDGSYPNENRFLEGNKNQPVSPAFADFGTIPGNCRSNDGKDICNLGQFTVQCC